MSRSWRRPGHCLVAVRLPLRTFLFQETYTFDCACGSKTTKTYRSALGHILFDGCQIGSIPVRTCRLVPLYRAVLLPVIFYVATSSRTHCLVIQLILRIRFCFLTHLLLRVRLKKTQKTYRSALEPISLDRCQTGNPPVPSNASAQSCLVPYSSWRRAGHCLVVRLPHRTFSFQRKIHIPCFLFLSFLLYFSFFFNWFGSVVTFGYW